MKSSVLVVGSINYDIVIDLDHHPVPGETIIGNDVRYEHGGKGANQAVASAQASGETYMFGFIGNDTYGSILKENLESKKVNIENIQTIEGASGQAFIQVSSKGENSIVVIPGANMQKPFAYKELLYSLIEDATVVLIQSEVSLDLNLMVAEYAHKLSKTVIWNPAPFIESHLQLLDYCSIITPNEIELNLLVDTNDPLEIKAKSLIEEGIDAVILTQGAKGATVVSKDSVTHYSAPKVKVKDTVGAGDTFNGFLAALLSLGYELEDAVALSVNAASISVSRLGTQRAIPSLKEVMEYRGGIK